MWISIYIYICIGNVVIYTYIYMECVSTYIDIVGVCVCMYIAKVFVYIYIYVYVYTYMYMKNVEWGWTLEECCLDSSQTPVTLIPRLALQILGGEADCLDTCCHINLQLALQILEERPLMEEIPVSPPRADRCIANMYICV